MTIQSAQLFSGVQIEPQKTTINELQVDDGLLAGPNSLILWCLRVVIAIQCFGLGGRLLFSAHESESDVFGLLFFDWDWPETTAQLVDDFGAYGCLVAAAMLVAGGLISSCLSKSQQRVRFFLQYFESLALVFVATWTILMAAAHSVRGEVYAELALAEQAVRFATPLAMLVLIYKPDSSSKKSVKIATLILTIAVAVTFIAHGYIAKLYGPFVDLILLTDMRLFKTSLDQSMAETFLKIIGWVDIIAGVLLLITRWRIIAIYMLIWGLITAASRMTALGTAAWPETLVRAANVGAPLVLFLLYSQTKKLTRNIAAPKASD